MACLIILWIVVAFCSRNYFLSFWKGSVFYFDISICNKELFVNKVLF